MAAVGIHAISGLTSDISFERDGFVTSVFCRYSGLKSDTKVTISGVVFSALTPVFAENDLEVMLCPVRSLKSIGVAITLSLRTTRGRLFVGPAF